MVIGLVMVMRMEMGMVYVTRRAYFVDMITIVCMYIVYIHYVHLVI